MQNNSLVNLYKITPKNKFYYVLWNIGSRCNYACSYCSPNLHSFTAPHLPLDKMIKVIDELSKIDKEIKIHFTGGEPTVNPNFLEFISYIRNNYHEKYFLGLTTNGSRTSNYYNKISKIVDIIVFSTHFEYIRDPIKFIDKIKNIKNCSVNIMLEPKYWNEVITVFELCIKNNIKYDLKRIHGNYYNYSNEQINFINKNIINKSYTDIVINDTEEISASTLVNLKLNKFKGWNCNMGVDSIYINSDGSVKRASCDVWGSLGNIYNNFSLKNSPVTCDKEECNCIADVRLKKNKL